jgi:hypothetical protein
MERDRVVLRPRSGRWLAAAVRALCVLNLVPMVVLHEWGSLMRALPIVALTAVAVWVLFGIPAVIVQNDAVVLVNPWREIRIPRARSSRCSRASPSPCARFMGAV